MTAPDRSGARPLTSLFRSLPLAVAIMASLAALAGASFASERGVSFDDVAAGSLPQGWKVEATNPRGPVATWAVKADDGAPSKPNVLALTDTKESSGSTFNLVWTDRLPFKDGVIEVKVRAETGREDQGGGPIWRVRDRDNYYVARYNPLERNFRIYTVENGRRHQLASDGGLVIGSGQWFAIRIVQKGSRIEGWIDGTKLLEVEDSTFADVGGVGLWTKADAATAFDDLVIRAGD